MYIYIGTKSVKTMVGGRIYNIGRWYMVGSNANLTVRLCSTAVQIINVPIGSSVEKDFPAKMFMFTTRMKKLWIR